MTLIIAFLLAVCLPHEPSLAKKPTAEPPPVLYQIQFFDPPGSRIFGLDMNMSGCVVGQYVDVENHRKGFVYNHPNWPGFVDLNDIVSGLPDGWRIRNATGVNDLGDIAGYIVPDDENPDKLSHVCFIDMNVDPPELTEMPNPEQQFGHHMVAREINNWGDIFGTFVRDDENIRFLYNPGYLGTAGYGPVDLDLGTAGSAINDNLQIAGRFPDNGSSFRGQIVISDAGDVTVEEIEILGGLSNDYGGVADINNLGVVLGRTAVRVGKGNKTVWACYRYDDAPEFLFYGGNPAEINDDGDFITNVYGQDSKPWIYLDAPLGDPDGDPLGFFYIDELIDPADPDAEVWFASYVNVGAINNRITDEDGNIAFGQIAGTIMIDGVELGYVLTPTE